MASRQLLFRTFYRLGFVPWDGHPLFISYVKAALDHQRAAQAEKVAA